MKIFQAKILLLIQLLTIGLWSCNKSEKEVYPYIEGFRNYMKEQHSIDTYLIEDIRYVIVSLNGCEPCIKGALRIIAEASAHPNTHLILVNEAEDSQVKDLLHKIESRYDTIYTDPQGIIGGYSTGFSYPILVHIEEGKAEKYIDVTADYLDEFQQYL